MVAMVPGICTHDYAYRAAKTIQIFEKIMVTIHLHATIYVILYFEVLIKKMPETANYYGCPFPSPSHI